MVKKIVSLMIIIFVNILIWNWTGVCAVTEGTVYLEKSKETVKKGEEFEISYSISGQNVAAYNVNIYFDENKFDVISKNENMNVVKNHLIIVWYDSQGGIGAKQGELGKIKFRAKQEGVATFTVDGEFYTEKGQLIQTDFKDASIYVGEKGLQGDTVQEEGKKTNIELSNTNLEILAIENALLNPAFENNITKYNTQVSNQTTKLNILAIPENEKAKVDIISNDIINDGTNTVQINITAQDGISKKEIIIEVYKRTLTEEKKYQDQQEKVGKEEKSAYEIEKASTTNEEDNAKKEKKISYGAIAVSLVVIFDCVYLRKIKKKKFK